jgi:hypothetical protein
MLGRLPGLCGLPSAPADEKKPDARDADSLPKPGTLAVLKERQEVILSAVVQHPKVKPCIDDWGGRIQAFVGCSKAAGGEGAAAIAGQAAAVWQGRLPGCQW